MVIREAGAGRKAWWGDCSHYGAHWSLEWKERKVDTILVMRGAVIGFSVAAPIGPNGMLCIRRTLAYGRIAGLMSGLGASTVHAAYAAVAALGLAVVTNALTGSGLLLHALGGAFLCYLGLKAFRARPDANARCGERDLLGIFLSTIVLTLANPLTIISFSALLSGSGLAGSTGGGLSTLLLVFGVMLGSVTWWCALSGGTSMLRRYVTASRLAWINKLSGAMVGGVGLLAVTSVVWALR